MLVIILCRFSLLIRQIVCNIYVAICNSLKAVGEILVFLGPFLVIVVLSFSVLYIVVF